MATRLRSSGSMPLRSRVITTAIFLVVILLVMAGAIASFYTDLLWFQDMGHASVFFTRIWSETGAGLAFG